MVGMREELRLRIRLVDGEMWEYTWVEARESSGVEVRGILEEEYKRAVERERRRRD